MPSPFPGMDPYLEAVQFWPDLHGALAAEIRNELNRTLPRPDYAILQSRPELGIPAEPTTHTETIRHQFVEIRDSAHGHKLITLIEILSPSNKRPGPDREAYERKQREVLESDASLIEIDLLRSGERVVPDPSLAVLLSQFEPPSDYVVFVSRAWHRATGSQRYQIFRCGLREWLPCFPVPLREREAEVPLDLQFVFNRAYEGGAYRRAVDYHVPPSPPLSDPDTAWAEALISAWEQAAP